MTAFISSQGPPGGGGPPGTPIMPSPAGKMPRGERKAQWEWGAVPCGPEGSVAEPVFQPLLSEQCILCQALTPRDGI